MEDFGMLMGDDMDKDRTRQPYVVMRDDGDDVCFLSDSDTPSLEDILGGSVEDSPLYFVEELEEKHLMGQIGVLNNLFSKLQDYQKPSVPNGISARVSAYKTMPVYDEHSSVMETACMKLNENLKDPNYVNVSSPEGKRQRKPNIRYKDTVALAGITPRLSTTDNTLKSTQPHEYMDIHERDIQQGDQLIPSSSYLVDVGEIQNAQDENIGTGEIVAQLEEERNVLIQADDLHDGFDSGLGAWPSSLKVVGDTSGLIPEVEQPIRPKQGNNYPKKSLSTAHLFPSRQIEPASDHEKQTFTPSLLQHAEAHPGKRRPKPNPRFLDEGEDVLATPDREKHAMLNSHPRNHTKAGITLSLTALPADNDEAGGIPPHSHTREAAARVRRAAVRSKVLSGSLRLKKRRRREEEGRYRSVQAMNIIGDVMEEDEVERDTEDEAEERMDEIPRKAGGAIAASMLQRRKKTRTHMHMGSGREREPVGKSMYLVHPDSDVDVKYHRKLTHHKAHSSREIGEGLGRRSKHHNPWALEEAEALVEGVALCGGGKWADIKKLGHPAILSRSAVDLKDKWRNLLRIAMLPSPPAPKTGDKKREIPPSLLARVRELSSRTMKVRPPDGRSKRSRSSESP